jgi:hypothetical protein
VSLGPDMRITIVKHCEICLGVNFDMIFFQNMLVGLLSPALGFGVDF